MNRTKIEYCDYTWNVIKGWCPNDCPYCYAHRLYKWRGWDKTIRFDEKELKALKKPKTPSRIFVGSMIDMYHPEIPAEWVERIIDLSAFFPQHTFITLTKFPEQLYKFNFPPNWWVGVTIDDKKYYDRELYLLSCPHIQGKIFVSLEPLLTDINNLMLGGLDWIIIGGLTPKPIHKTEWIDGIVRRANGFKIPVFIKQNAKYDIVREEFPE